MNTIERVRLANMVIRILPLNLDHLERPLVRHVTDFLTGSDMVTTDRFKSAQAANLSELECSWVRGIIRATLKIVTDPTFPYEEEVVHLDRLGRLLDIVDETSGNFDFERCKARIVELVADGHYGFYAIIDDELSKQELDAVLKYLSCSETLETTWFLRVLDQAAAGRASFSRESISQISAIVFMVERFYPSVVVAQRKDHLVKALEVSRNILSVFQ